MCLLSSNLIASVFPFRKHFDNISCKLCMFSGAYFHLFLLQKMFQVEYEVLPGWQCDISSIRNYNDLPPAACRYIERIEELVGVPIHYIGVGPGRDALITK